MSRDAAPTQAEVADDTDAEIERLMAGGYCWHSAYLRALTDRHARDARAIRNHIEGSQP